MNESSIHRLGWPAVILLTGALVTFASAVQAQPPVSVEVSLEGMAAPRSTVRATANVEIRDGSAVRSYAWTQTGGVPADLMGAGNRTARLTLGRAWMYRDRLLHVLSEPPIGPGQLPPNVPPPDGEFPGGLQNRFQLVGIYPFALEEAGLVTLEVAVTTTSGTYRGEAEIHTALPWESASGIRNVSVGNAVLLYGKEQSRYNWTLVTPPSSNASLMGHLSRSPWFTPDVPGVYEVQVRDREAGALVTMTIFAGLWRGVIVGQDAAGRPVAEDLCTACHRSGFAPDLFTPWARTGHAQIFSDNLNTSTHYSSRCFGCHTVGYDPNTDNGGFDNARDYSDFMGGGLLNNPGDNWTTVLDEFPATAQLANIQCESCHGPQSSEERQDTLAHGWRSDVEGEPRVSFSSDVCATCHGEPLRHGRFQQWQLSGHANYELAIDESGSGNCSRCHTANGFLAWMPELVGGDPTANVTVDWTADETHPQTCVTCHDPHDIGTTSGDGSNAKVRIRGNTPVLLAGYRVLGAGDGAICMTCHNARRGLRNDATFTRADASRAPHGSSQTDVLMGENAYLVNVGVRGRHSFVEDTCVRCHMEDTPPPDMLSYNQGGTNHTFFASPDICSDCHEGVSAEALQAVVDAVLGHLQGLIEGAARNLITAQTNAGYALDLDGEATVDDAGEIRELVFGEHHGRQALTFLLRDGRTVGPLRVSDITVMRPAPLGPTGLWDLAGEGLIKAGWNWLLVHNDGSRGVHNPTFVLEVLDAARDALGGQGGPRAILPFDPNTIMKASLGE